MGKKQTAKNGATMKASGPLFVVGMSRSGTKLLRDLLNNNSKITIPASETHFIPTLLSEFKNETFPLSSANKDKLNYIVSGSIFAYEIARKNPDFQGFNIDDLASKDSIQELIEEIIRTSSAHSKRTAPIWGDKTPNYLTHIALLRESFPTAKFVHIIRDPRERALSAKTAWGASLEVSAERWRNSVQRARKQGEQANDSYLEVHYEKLLDKPEITLQKVCKFIGVEYSKQMLRLTKPVENHQTAGESTAETTSIVVGNTNKFKQQLSSRQIASIEQIVAPIAEDFGYQSLHYKGEGRPLKGIRKRMLFLRDKLSSFLYHTRRWGLVQGVKFVVWRSRII